MTSAEDISNGELDRRKNITDALRRLTGSREVDPKALFEEMARRSYDYQTQLRLRDNDVSRLIDQRMQVKRIARAKDLFFRHSFLTVRVGKNEFRIIAKETDCHPYGPLTTTEFSQNFLVAIADDDKLNRSTGSGLTYINVVPEEWHQRILEAIGPDVQQEDLAAELFRKPK